jgi:glycosyltransferase involved in cell wall biosynthesis
MRVLILTPEYSHQGGGIATFYSLLAPALRDEGITLRIVQGSGFNTQPDAGRICLDGIQIETLEKRRLLTWHTRFGRFASAPSLRTHLAAAWAMWEQAREGAAFDLVEACDWGLSFVPPAISCSVPVVVQLHGSLGQVSVHDPMRGEETGASITRLLESGVLGHLGVLQTSSNANARFWENETGRRVDKILPAFRVPALAPRVRVSGAHGLVVGRLQRWKGPETVCRALRLLGPRAPLVDWVGRDVSWCAREQSAARHLSRTFPDVWRNRLRHIAPVTREEVAERQASCLFNMVASSWDVFNFTAAEAMCSGRPIIVSSGAGASELVEHGNTGYLFQADDPASLAEVLDQVLGESPTRLAEVGAAARAMIEARLNPSLIAAERVNAYRSAVAAFKAGGGRAIGQWLSTTCTPEENAIKTGAFLEQYPISLLARHTLSRLGGRAKACFARS